nr:PREDICTED: selenoprotein K-like isoform X1 [Saccoglossus kowalevskii]XP_006811289.1 PREDICTED: selenoprotein K-like isoform X2 [Saccoglossus kowalevskii]
MVYVSEGHVLDSQSPWRISAIPDLFWGILNFIVLFFQTMVSPGLTKKGSGYTSDYRSGSDKWGPPRPPRRRMGGFRGGGGGPNPPPPAGGG